MENADWIEPPAVWIEPPADWIEPPAACTLARDEIHFWRANLTEASSALHQWETLLNAEERARANRYAFARDRVHYICARGILRELLGRYLDAPAATIQFAYTAHGKPFLPANHEPHPLQFNVTHSGQLALYAFTWHGRIGIDVEQVRADLDFQPLLESIFTPRERAVIIALPNAQARRAFFTGWARKEAFIKARGEGLSYPLHQFEVSLLPHKPNLLHLLVPDEKGAQWTPYALDAGPEYTAAAVSEGPPKSAKQYHLPSRATAQHAP